VNTMRRHGLRLHHSHSDSDYKHYSELHCILNFSVEQWSDLVFRIFPVVCQI